MDPELAPPLIRPGSTAADRAWAAAHGIPVVPEAPRTGLALERRDGVLTLVRRGAESTAVALDFVAGPLARRLASLDRRDPLARAVGLHRRSAPVLDATAGLGRDAAALAVLGAEVLAVERHPVPFRLLADGIERAGAVATPPAWLRRLRCTGGDATDVLPSAPREVVVLDPMYPPPTKHAAVRAEAQLLRELVGEEDGEAQRALLDRAREAARDRVVVKRPLHAPPLADGVSFAVRGRRVRFDVYLAR